jgi:hypothetical protein
MLHLQKSDNYAARSEVRPSWRAVSLISTLMGKYYQDFSITIFIFTLGLEAIVGGLFTILKSSSV